MANLQIKGIDDDMYVHLKALAASEHRSVSQQVLSLVRAYLAEAKYQHRSKTAGAALLELSGSWEDARDAQEIVQSLKSQRKRSHRLTEGF
jgi:plasmid stability protein